MLSGSLIRIMPVFKQLKTGIPEYCSGLIVKLFKQILKKIAWKFLNKAITGWRRSLAKIT